MASQHIEITGTETRISGDLRRFIDTLRRAMNEHERLLGVLDEAYTGNDANGLAVALGLPSAQAMTVRTYLAAIQDEMTASQLVTFVNRLG